MMFENYKRNIFLLLFLILVYVNCNNIFAQTNEQPKNSVEGNGYITGLPQNAREGVTEERKREIERLSANTLFGNLQGKWFDGALYNVLKFFDSFFLYFMGKVKIIAMICFSLSLGIGCVKLLLGGVEINKFLVQMFMSVVTCMIIIAIFPSVMRNILGITTQLAKEAAFNQPLRNDLELYYRDQAFKDWLIKIAAPDMVKQMEVLIGENWVKVENEAKFNYSQQDRILDMQALKEAERILDENPPIGYYKNANNDETAAYTNQLIMQKAKMIKDSYVRMANIQNPDQLNSLFRANGSDVESVLSMNIINSAGLISINQLGRTIFITLKGLWGTLSTKRKWDNIGGYFAQFLFVVVITLMYLFTACMGVVNYMMVLVQFGFLYGVGILFIPLMLWDGTKTMFEKIAGSTMNITVHLLVKSLVLMLIVFINIDILRNCFLMSEPIKNVETDFMQKLEYYFSAAFLTIFLKMMNDQSTSIADFLCGGAPRLSFGEFAQAASSFGAAGMAAAGAGKAIAGGAAKTALGVGGAMVGAAGNMAATKAAGGNFGDILGSGASSLGNSLVAGVDSLGGKAVGALANAPNTLKGAAQMMRYGMHPVGSLTAEGIGMQPRRGPGGGGHGGGGGSGGGQSEEEKRAGFIKQMNSEDVMERAKGAFGLAGMDNKSNDPNSFSGRMKGIANGFKNMRRAESANAVSGPASFNASEQLQKNLQNAAADGTRGKAAG